MIRRLRDFTGNLERADTLLVGSVMILLALGAVVVFGAGSYNRQAASSPFGQHYILIKHLFMIGVGGLLMMALMNVDYHLFRNRWLNWGALVISLLLVAATLINPEDRHINRWLTVFGFSFQPVELAKLSLIFFLAERLSWLQKARRLTVRNLALVLLAGPVPLGFLLVKQPNFGNVMTIVGTSLVLIFVAGVCVRWLAVMLALPTALGILAFQVVPKLNERLTTWLQGLLEGDYPYQVKQSLIGLGAGGWKGLGVGHSHNKFFFLPESHTDFAFSVLGEEWGLTGTLGVITLVVIIAWRGYSISARTSDPFGKMVAAGLTTGLAIYGIVNIAMVTGIFPVIGVPLPFVSFGGTAMIASMAAVGIILNIERGNQSYNNWKDRWDQNGNNY